MVSIKNMGKFELPRSFIQNETELVVKIFSRLKIVPIHCETLFHRDVICYTAISESFQEIPMYEEPPEYDINICRDDDSNLISAKFIPKPAEPYKSANC